MAPRAAAAASPPALASLAPHLGGARPRGSPMLSPTWEISARMMARYCLPCPRASMAARNSLLSWISFTTAQGRGPSVPGWGAVGPSRSPPGAHILQSGPARGPGPAAPEVPFSSAPLCPSPWQRGLVVSASPSPGLLGGPEVAREGARGAPSLRPARCRGPGLCGAGASAGPAPSPLGAPELVRGAGRDKPTAALAQTRLWKLRPEPWVGPAVTSETKGQGTRLDRGAAQQRQAGSS